MYVIAPWDILIGIILRKPALMGLEKHGIITNFHEALYNVVNITKHTLLHLDNKLYLL